MGALTPSMKSGAAPGQNYSSYTGPYVARKRTYNPKPEGETGSKEHKWFTEDYNEAPYHSISGNPAPGWPGYVAPQQYDSKGKPMAGPPPGVYPNAPMPYVDPRSGMQMDPMTGQLVPIAMATGGLVSLKPGGFVVNADTVEKAGGPDEFAGLGGKAIRGPGTGTSDSIPARIGKRPARVSNGEVMIGPKGVKKAGGGNPRRGARKLYAMMDHARSGA
jgi:hypothetical protein